MSVLRHGIVVRAPRRDGVLVVGLCLIAALLGAAVPALAPAHVLAGIVVLAVIVACASYPPFGAYLVLGTTPLIAGIDRGLVIPVLRPSEAVAILVAVAVAPRAIVELAARAPSRIRFGRVDAAILLLAIAGSVLPIVMMVLREREISTDDWLYASQIWKYYALFLIVRICVRTERQVRTCLWTSMGAVVIVAVVAVLQSLQMFGVPGLLSTYYAPFQDTSALDNQRGTSTLASSGAVADVMVYSLTIALAWLITMKTHRLAAIGLCAVFVFGTIAAGQFAGYLGIVVGITALGIITRRLGRLTMALLPVVIVAGVALWPVLERRLSGFQSASGLPPSWEGRLHNLRTYFWPELTTDYSWVLGVRPAARVPAPEPWRDWIFIESGHTWLLWTGGVPLVAAFVIFLVVTMRRAARVARERTDAVGVAALASFSVLAVLCVLTISDPHLTLRGSADLSFALLALMLSRTSASDGSSVDDAIAPTAGRRVETQPSNGFGRRPSAIAPQSTQ